MNISELTRQAEQTWWESPEWHAYEAAGGYPSRVEELAHSTWQTRVIDLSVSEAELWKGIRKSYKSLIHRAEREYWFIYPTVATAHLDGDIMRGLHDEVAGRETRPAETWDMMVEWMRSDHGLSVLACTAHGNWVAYAYFIIHGQWAYYHSAASLEPNINHALIWHAMKALKARGVRWVELGWQGEAHDEKGKQIEFLKRGFGGFDMPAKDAPRLAHAPACLQLP